MPETKCSGCGSADVIPDMKIVDHGWMDLKHDLAIDFKGKPNAWIFKDTRQGVLSASVCGQCGKVELSIDNAREMWEVYKSHRGA